MGCHIFLYSMQLNGLLFQEFPQALSFSVGYTLALLPNGRYYCKIFSVHPYASSVLLDYSKRHIGQCI